MRPGLISEKTDVYSFGILLVVLLTGRTPWERVEGIEIIPYASGCDGRIGEILDPRIYEEVGGNEQVQQQSHDFLELALLCTRDDIEGRPYMVDVARELIRIEEFVLASWLRSTTFVIKSIGYWFNGNSNLHVEDDVKGQTVR
ncbi:wall-associated receptor kinase-like 4 [Pyrus ussuriensis x Pyrus communis]|uniref:Wall-associated receptor kinase-like 4 n=1 Tax=Pyrus ussuriensis x Pyrus communis TaxID=2448454 RepID=A0A5N5IED5_9ROSA|nr:wall-associated receptor kinase-like 4 [Pyrus ussuriensis x Pyrus communis]